jgi:hypothetical protein
MRIPRALKHHLTNRDRWTVAEMLQDQPDLTVLDPERDMDLWRHLFHPEDLVRVGRVTTRAAEAQSAEYCSGNTWLAGEIIATVAVCFSALELSRGASFRDAMTRSRACEAILGRMRARRMSVVMIVDDGADGLECWLDTEPGSFPVESKGRCPGGTNNKTGRIHRVVWADPATRIEWETDEAIEEVA